MIPRAYITEWRQYAPWVSDAQFEHNLLEKANIPSFIEDILPLLSSEIEAKWNLAEALSLIEDRIFPHLKGLTWKGR